MSWLKRVLIGVPIIIGMYVVVYFGVSYQITSTTITALSQGEKRWTLGEHFGLVMYNLGLSNEKPEVVDWILSQNGDDSIWYDEQKREQWRQELNSD